MRQRAGLAYWMHEVLQQADRASDGFQADPVHDLRVAIRRCRSIAEGLRAVDPDPRWKKMRRAGKELFASLGRLRDAQVMMDWIGKLASADDPAARTLLAYCQAQEQSFKKEAELILDGFERRQWQNWASALPRRAARVQLGREPFEALALERWMQARRLHNLALRTGRHATFHRLRIAVKKFRYVVENFLPELHEQWSQGLKHFQDLLGEVQDLTVLWETAIRIGALEDPEARERWDRLVLGEREARIERYRSETTGDASLWQVWRAGLPHGKQVKAAGLKKLQMWASFFDPDVRHSKQVARLALQIHQGLVRLGLAGADTKRSTELLVAATSVVGVGRSAHGKGHPKKGDRIIQGAERPLSWRRRDLDTVAAIVRFHQGSLPGIRQSRLRQFPAQLRRLIQRLAGVIRLADALGMTGKTSLGKITVSNPGDFLLVSAEGLKAESKIAERIASARYLLELSLGMPVFVKPKKSSNSPKTKALQKKSKDYTQTVQG